MKTFRNLALAALVFMVPFAANAAVDKAIITNVLINSAPNPVNAMVAYMDGNSLELLDNVSFSVAGVTTTESFIAAAEQAALDWGLYLEYDLAAEDIIWPGATVQNIDDAIDSLLLSFHSVATTGDFDDLLDKPAILRAELVTGTVSGGSGVASIDISAHGFTSVKGVIWEPVDDTAVYTFGSLSSGTSTVSATVKKQAFTSGNALLNLLGGLVSVLTGVSQTNAPNSTAVRATVIGY